jgi:hypothetical protein
MSDNNQTDKLIPPVLSVNIGQRQRPVVVVKKEVSNLTSERDAKLKEIEKAKMTDPDNTSLLEELNRDLTLIDNSIVSRNDVLKARGHARTPIADSA